MVSEPVSITLQVAEILESLGVPYVIGGSMASTAHSRIRTTMFNSTLPLHRYMSGQPISTARMQLGKCKALDVGNLVEVAVVANQIKTI